MMLQLNYPTPPMSAIPTVLLEAFLAERRVEVAYDEDVPMSEVDKQRTHALYVGAVERARTCGGLAGHDCQAAAILLTINDLELVLGGASRVGGRSEFVAAMDPDEINELNRVRETLARLLEWHFENGAGRLLPIAKWMNLTRPEASA